MVTAEDKNMSSTNINNYNDRERKVLELYDDGKNTRDIAKELRMFKKARGKSWNCIDRR